jgi:hypothetical protein
VPGFPLGGAELQSALQVSQGLELALPADIVLGATGFLSRWTGLTDLTAECVQMLPGNKPPERDPNGQLPVPPPFVCPSNHPVTGHAYGLELLVRRPLTKRLSGWLSYTLSRSMRAAHFVTASGVDAVATVPSEGDRTHVFNAIAAYDLGRHWRAGGRFVFYTGNPYSKMDGDVPLPPYNDQRFPNFFRVDVRLEKRWSFGKNGSLALVFEGQNVTLKKESAGLDCRVTGMMGGVIVNTSCSVDSVGPISIPSIGIEAFF